jgi:hypothetical protein
MNVYIWIKSTYVLLKHYNQNEIWGTLKVTVSSFSWSTTIPFVPHSTAHTEWSGCTMWTKMPYTIWTSKQWKWYSIRIHQISHSARRITPSLESSWEQFRVLSTNWTFTWSQQELLIFSHTPSTSWVNFPHTQMIAAFPRSCAFIWFIIICLSYSF